MLSSPSILAVPPSKAIAPNGGMSITIASVTNNKALAIPTAKANVKGCTEPSNKLIARKPPINKATGKSILCKALPIQPITSKPLSKLVPKKLAVPPSKAIAVIGAINKTIASAIKPIAIAIPRANLVAPLLTLFIVDSGILPIA